MHNTPTAAPHPPHRGGTLGEPDGRPLVVVVGELATYISRPGETRPFVEEGPIPNNALVGSSSAPSPSSTSPTARQDAVSRLLSRLREYLLDRNTIVIISVCSSHEYRERIVMFFFEKLQVRTITVLSDAVADAFATGLKDSLVLHATPSVLSISRVEAGATIKSVECAAGSLFKLLGCTGSEVKMNLLEKLSTVSGAVERVNRSRFVDEEDSSAKAPSWRLSTEGVFHNTFCLSSSHSSSAVDLLDEGCRDALVSLVGKEVYERVVSSTQGKGSVERSLNDRNKDNINENEGTTALVGEIVTRGRGVLRRLIASVADGAPLPVIVSGESLRVAPILQKFIKETVHTYCETHAEARGSSSPSLSSSDISTTVTTRSRSSSSSSLQNGGSLYMQPLPLEELPWELPVIGGSLVSQLSLAELSKLRISRDDALSSRGSIVHWRSLM